MPSSVQRDEGASSARWPHALPSAIAALTAGGVWEQITIGMSGVSVYRIIWPTPPQPSAIYLKIAPPAQRAELLDERARLDWLADAAPGIGAPCALAYADAGDFAYLALSRVVGLMACDAAFDAAFDADQPLIARLLGEGMRQIHAIDATRCPFDRRLERTLAE